MLKVDVADDERQNRVATMQKEEVENIGRAPRKRLSGYWRECAEMLDACRLGSIVAEGGYLVM